MWYIQAGKILKAFERLGLQWHEQEWLIAWQVKIFKLAQAVECVRLNVPQMIRVQIQVFGISKAAECVGGNRVEALMEQVYKLQVMQMRKVYIKYVVSRIVLFDLL